MKEEIWSLKGKEVYAFDDELMDKVEAENLAKDMEVEIIKLFEARFVIILREKIIELLDEWIKNEIPTKAYEGLIEKLNRLFGTEEVSK